MEQIRTFSPRATRSLWTLPDPFLGTERCPSVLYTLCKFHPATRSGLGCTWVQWRPCRDPGHRHTHSHTHSQTDAPSSNSKLDLSAFRFFFRWCETEYMANFSHRRAFSGSLHYSMSIMAIDPVCPQTILSMRVTLFPSGMICITNIPSIKSNNTLFCSVLNGKQAGERFWSLQLIVF